MQLKIDKAFLDEYMVFLNNQLLFYVTPYTFRWIDPTLKSSDYFMNINRPTEEEKTMFILEFGEDAAKLLFEGFRHKLIIKGR